MSTTSQLNTKSIATFVAEKNIKSLVPVVRANTNNYPYITVIDDKNVAENIYFSKNGAKMVGAGIPVTKELLSQFQIAECKNAAGELRTKLVSNAERKDISLFL